MEIAGNQNSAQQTIPTSQYDRMSIDNLQDQMEQLQMERIALIEENIYLKNEINNNNR